MTTAYLISADFDALSSDAKKWDKASESIATMKSSLTTLPARASAFSFAGAGLSERYDEIRKTLLSSLESGAAETQRIAETLRDIRRQYEDDEAKISDDLRRMWHPAE